MSVLAFDTPGGPVTCRGVTPDLRDYFDAQAPRWPVVDARSGAEEITVQTDAGGGAFDHRPMRLRIFGSMTGWGQATA